MQNHTLGEQEEALRARVRALPDPLRARYHHNVLDKVKDPDTYAVLNFLLIAGLHHYYLKKWVRGSLNLIIFSAAIVLMSTQLWWQGGATLLFVLLIELPQLFRSQQIVREYNLKISERELEAILRRPK